MTPAETAKLLTLAAAYDNRTFDELACRAWADTLEDLPFEDCVTAVKAHYRNTRDWLMPADVRHGVRQIRRQRAIEANAERQRELNAATPADPETIRDYRQQIDTAIANLGKLPDDVAHVYQDAREPAS